ncbi:MAG: hypothetical protein MUC51_08405 [Anaerolineae bacterium]|nr:hypothetical protein [Anaerolineae bacterium]
MADYNTAPLREFIIEHFSDQELATFSFDNFRYAYEGFAEGMSKTEKVQRLIESCVRRDELLSLLAALRKERTRLYDAKRLGELVLDTRPVQTPNERDLGSTGRVPTPFSARLSSLFAATRHHRLVTAIVVAIALLVLSVAAFLVWGKGQGTPKNAGCQLAIGQPVHIPEGVWAWSPPDVNQGAVTRVFGARTPVYVIGGSKLGVISYGTSIPGWWWEVSETPNGGSIGWVWEGQIEDCQSAMKTP